MGGILLREIILLGAGASVEAGIPDASGMTEKIAETFRESRELQDASRVLSFIIGGLLFKIGISGENALKAGVNVEDLFNAVQLLAERGHLEAAPFIGSWHAFVEELDQIEPPEASLPKFLRAIQKGVAEQIKLAVPKYISSHAKTQLDRSLHDSINRSIERHIITNNMSRAIKTFIEEYIKEWMDNLKNSTPRNPELELELKKLADQKPKPGQGYIFRQVAEEMIRALIDIVWIEDMKKIRYLYPLVNLAKKQSDIIIASLNYDNAIELTAASTKVKCDTGILEWSEKGKFSFPAEGIILLKLHGSIDWEEFAVTLPHMINHIAVRPVNISARTEEGYKPAVIFGQRNKLTAEGPFLDILQSFVKYLETSDRLTVIGYSFSDSHINALLARWLNGNISRKIRIVNPFYGNIRGAFIDGISRIGPDRCEILEAKTGPALIKLYGEYQEV